MTKTGFHMTHTQRQPECRKAPRLKQAGGLFLLFRRLSRSPTYASRQFRTACAIVAIPGPIPSSSISNRG